MSEILVITFNQSVTKGMNQMKLLQKVSFIGLLLALITVGPVSVIRAENIDPDDIDAQYAWGENIGWLNAEPGGQGDPGLTVTATTVTGFIWAENIGWISLSCSNTGSCATVDYGVSIDDANGQFSGHAWSENIGWISFDAVSMIHDGIITAWTIGECTGNLDGDNDVDGMDLHIYILDGHFGDINEFSGNFGRVCP